MAKRILDYDEFTGIITWFHDDDDADTFHTTQTQDVQPFVEANKAKQNMDGDGKAYWRSGGDFRHEATVPMNILMHWAEQDGVPGEMIFSQEYAKRIAKKLNNPDYAVFKTGRFTM